MVMVVVESTGCPFFVAGLKRICCATRRCFFIQAMSQSTLITLLYHYLAGGGECDAENDVSPGFSTGGLRWCKPPGGLERTSMPVIAGAAP